MTTAPRTAASTISYRHSANLDLFLAMQRDLMGRFAWETSVLPRPAEPVVARFRDGIRAWRKAGVATLPSWLASVDTPAAMLGITGDPGFAEGTRWIVDALEAAGPRLSAALASLEPERTRAVENLPAQLRLDDTDGPLRAALGVGDEPYTLALHLVTLAPHPPASGFITDSGRLAGAYIDCRRFVGPTLADGTLTLLGWALLKEFRGPDHLSAVVAALLPGSTPYARRLRAVLTKILVELTAGHLMRSAYPGHRDCVDVLGTAWRYPRLFAVAERHWRRYLTGLADRREALSAMAVEIAAYSPRWYVDHVDASSLAADFYLMEWLAAAGDEAAARRLAHWLPQLAEEMAGQLDLIIGAELGHYERVKDASVSPPLAEFLRSVTTGDSRVGWPPVRTALGSARALDLASQAFSGPGAEFGGEAWAPVAAMLRRYVRKEIPLSVFVDQCFTLQHNNGSLFDKYCDTDHVLTVLDAQAAGDVDTLAAHASPEVRLRWREHGAKAARTYDAVWLGVASAPPGGKLPDDSAAGSRPALRGGRPGVIGCGSPLEPEALAAGSAPGAEVPVHLRRPVFRRPFPWTPRRYAKATATLLTDLGAVEMELLPESAPHAVDNFVSLARGTRPWTDPRTGRTCRGGFYDGTVFHRQIPGFLIQGGDRAGDGTGGPGYRIPEEVSAGATYDRPYLVGMSNSGKDSTGSQFFITLAPAPHLAGLFTWFGEVSDPAARRVVASIARAANPVGLQTVRVTTTDAPGDRL